jgi:predicted GNAT family acetyltransferase
MSVDAALVRHNPAESRFELPIEGEGEAAVLAISTYRRDEDGTYVLLHTFVPDAYAGKGIASALARGLFAMARAQGFKLGLRCPYMAAWSARHPDYADVVAY